MTILKELYWIAIDWGSSNLRVWALNNNNAILDSILSNDGMLGLASNEFEPLLFEKISKWQKWRSKKKAFSRPFVECFLALKKALQDMGFVDKPIHSSKRVSNLKLNVIKVFKTWPQKRKKCVSDKMHIFTFPLVKCS